MRGRYERGEGRDTFTLTELSADERRALEGLLGRPVKAAGSMRLSMAELDAAIARAGLASGLRAALEALEGPVREIAAERLAARESWSAVLSGIAEPRLVALVSNAAGAGLLKRLTGGDPGKARELAAQAARVLAQLPARGISLARLAAETIGDSHGLDAGRPLATVVLRACSTPNESDERPREQWARLGVTVNELAMPALCLNLGFAEPGEPTHISLRKLMRNPPDWALARRTVFVCENPNVVAIAADSLGPLSAPLVCTDGMPGAAQQTLLRQLAACGARLRYHGDFDWPGVSIGNFVTRTFAVEPWRFATVDYFSACAGMARDWVTHTQLSGTRIEASWDAGLATAMAESGVAVHEEAVVQSLLKDLTE
ncbi:MAG: TIGR02679 family protein [Steroidobacteraceae bacterium]